MKKLISAALSASLLVSSCAALAQDDIKINIDGKKLSFEAEPYIDDGTTLVPMRAVFEALGAEVVWNGEDRTVTSRKDGTEIVLTIGSNMALKNGVTRTITKAPVIVSDYTMVPIRFVCESFNCVVNWDGNTRTIDISTQNNLVGKSIAFVGDSICYGTKWEGGYAKIIGEQNNMTVTNSSKGGATIARNVKWSADSDGYRPNIIDMVSGLEGEYDYIIIEGGVNDFWNGVPAGDISGGYDGGYDESSMAGGIESIFNIIKNQHFSSKVGFVIIHDPFTYNAEENFEPYYRMMKKVCEKWNVPYIDLYEQNNTDNGVNVKNSEMCSLYFGTDSSPEGDGCHPNELGYRIIYVDPITTWLKSL